MAKRFPLESEDDVHIVLPTLGPTPSVTVKSDDDADDEQAGENDAGIGSADENVELPEEFGVDDEDGSHERKRPL